MCVSGTVSKGEENRKVCHAHGTRAKLMTRVLLVRVQTVAIINAIKKAP
jgi:hypothetical protein